MDLRTWSRPAEELPWPAKRKRGATTATIRNMQVRVEYRDLSKRERRFVRAPQKGSHSARERNTVAC